MNRAGEDRYKNCQTERSERREAVRDHDWELVSPSETRRNMIVINQS